MHHLIQYNKCELNLPRTKAQDKKRFELKVTEIYLMESCNFINLRKG